MGYAIAYTIFCIRDKKREPTVTAYSLKIRRCIQSVNYTRLKVDV